MHRPTGISLLAASLPPSSRRGFFHQTLHLSCPEILGPTSFVATVPSVLPGGLEEAKRVGRREGQGEHLLELQLRRWMANSCPSALRRPVPWPKATSM